MSDDSDPIKIAFDAIVASFYEPEPTRPRRRHLLKGCVWTLLAALLLAATIAGLGATSAPPRPTDSPIPSNVNTAY